MPTVPALWKRMADIIFSGNISRTRANAFPGFSCYSSDDLVNWKFERVVLPMQSNGILGPDRVGERVKVMKCPSTGEYVCICMQTI